MHTLLIALMMAPLLQAPATPAPEGNAQKGQAAYRGKLCNDCHGDDGQGGFGPDLAGGRGLTWEQFRHPIRKPWGVMPSWTEQQLSDQAIADIYAFLKTKPKVAEPGHWHWAPVPASAPYGQKVYNQIVGCAQCHEPENKFVRMWLGEHAKEVNYDYFKKLIYQHTIKYPTGGMGSYSPDRLSEENLRNIYKFLVEDLGLRGSMMGTAVQIAEQSGGNTTYKMSVKNNGVKGLGLEVEGVTVFVRVPAGTKVVAGTGPGYKGVQSFQSLNMVPALQLATHATEQGIITRPDYDKSGDAVVWKIPKVATQEKIDLTFTLAGAPTAELATAMDGSAVHWEKPGRNAFGKKLQYIDTRTPDNGDHERIAPVRLPAPASSNNN